MSGKNSGTKRLSRKQRKNRKVLFNWQELDIQSYRDWAYKFPGFNYKIHSPKQRAKFAQEIMIPTFFSLRILNTQFELMTYDEKWEFKRMKLGIARAFNLTGPEWGR